MKYKSNWPTYTLRSHFLSHKTNILGMTFLYQIVFDIWGIITVSWIYMSHWPNYILMSLFVSHGTNIKGMTFLHQSLRDIRHNHWTMKCRSIWPTYTLRSLLVSHEKNIQGRTFLFQTVFELWGINTGLWNIGHNDLIIFWGHSASHMELIFKVWHFSKIVIEI